MTKTLLLWLAIFTYCLLVFIGLWHLVTPEGWRWLDGFHVYLIFSLCIAALMLMPMIRMRSDD